MAKQKTIPWLAAIVLTGTLAIGITPSAMAGSHVTQALTATSHAPGARGHAKLALKTASKGRFRVVARGLAPRASFDLVVGGVKIGAFTTNGAGSGKVKLSTHPKPSEGLLGVDPRGKTIAVRDDNGDDDLEGDMPDDDGDDSAAGAFACCLPDDDGTECDTTTADECTAEGGTMVAGVDSCIPNPCGATPPSEVVCCFPGSTAGAFLDEEAEAECDEVSVAECAAAGGAVVQATSCDPNPCAPVPRPQVTVCCVPDGSESECEILTPEHCSALGTPRSATSCDPAPCGSSSGAGSGDSAEGSSGGTDSGDDGSSDG
jgi:hypothetical protein